MQLRYLILACLIYSLGGCVDDSLLTTPLRQANINVGQNGINWCNDTLRYDSLSGKLYLHDFCGWDSTMVPPTCNTALTFSPTRDLSITDRCGTKTVNIPQTCNTAFAYAPNGDLTITDACGPKTVNIPQTCNTAFTYAANGDLTITDACGPKTVNIPSAAPPDQCNGPFQRASNNTSWWAGWSPIETGNMAPVTSAWINVGAAQNAPDCISDMTFQVDFGNHLFYTRRCRTYFWISYRLLVNGAPVLTRTYEIYKYIDKRNDTNPDVIRPQLYEISDLGNASDVRLNIPAGATVQVQAQTRRQVVAAQASSYNRYIGGLRSNASFTFTPRNILIP